MPAHNFLIHRLNRRIAERLRYTGRVVDLGCGTAPYKDIILRQADEYIGVDWPRSYHGSDHVDVFADLGGPLPFDAGYADTVTAFQVLEHLPEPVRFLSECHRILKPGGGLRLVVPFMWQVHEAPYDFYRFTRHGLAHLATQVGFVDVEIEETTGFWVTWVLKLNYHTLRFARGPLRLLWLPLWWTDQMLAPLLDRLDHHPEETASYILRARRP